MKFCTKLHCLNASCELELFITKSYKYISRHLIWKSMRTGNELSTGRWLPTTVLNHETSKSIFYVKLSSRKRGLSPEIFLGVTPPQTPSKWGSNNQFLKIRRQFFDITRYLTVFDQRILHGGARQKCPHLTLNQKSLEHQIGHSGWCSLNFLEKLVLSWWHRNCDVHAIFLKTGVIFAMTSQAVQTRTGASIA